MESTYGIFCAHQNIWTRQEYHWLFLGENLLQAVVRLFTLIVIGRGKLLLHQPVDFCLPCCSGMRLGWIPEMRSSAGQQDIRVSCGVRIEAHQPQQTRVVLLRLQYAVEQGAEFERHYLHSHAQLL